MPKSSSAPTTAQPSDVKPDDQVNKLKQQITELTEQVRRAQADYSNLQRRTAEDQARLHQWAAKEVMTSLVEPLDHLSLAAAQLNDPGLNMVVEQLWQTLRQHGLEEIEVEGKAFDPEVMEAVHADSATQPDDSAITAATVDKVVKRGYRLNGQVLQHAKVMVK